MEILRDSHHVPGHLSEFKADTGTYAYDALTPDYIGGSACTNMGA